MPRRVDHEERRRQIADALLRTAATRGLHATGMREVAAEAGVSLRLVQYYFGTKEELLLSAMQYLAARFSERALARIRQTGSPASPRDVIAAILTEGLPADDDRRTFTVLYSAYFALSLTDPALAIAPLVRNSAAVIDVVAAQLRAAQAAGTTPAHLDPDLEAFSLLAMSAGLGTSILAGQSSPGQAQAVIDYHLHRLFPGSRPALRAREPTIHWSPGSSAGLSSSPDSGHLALTSQPPKKSASSGQPHGIATKVRRSRWRNISPGPCRTNFVVRRYYRILRRVRPEMSEGAFLDCRNFGEAAMTWEDLLAYCMAKPSAWQDEPWEGDVTVKVGAKIFAFFGSGVAASVGVKCGASRESADEWLLRYPDDASVMAYIGRSGWNTLRIGGTIPDDELIEAVDASYAAVVSKLPKKDRPPQS